jgi:phosphatidylethanolamine-binding protein (PEBP) family uncharacterized protein
MAASSPRRARKRRARARLSRVSAAGAVIAAGALAGCGSGGTASVSSASKPGLEVTSPALGARQTLPALYTCSGRDIVRPLKFGKVPASTAELALFLLDLGHTESTGAGALEAKLKVAWVIHGLKPTLDGIAAGKLPTEAIAGHQRYSICPPKGSTGQYMFRLYALPRPVSIPRGLSDLEAFRRINSASAAVGYVLSYYTRSS